MDKDFMLSELSSNGGTAHMQKTSAQLINEHDYDDLPTVLSMLRNHQSPQSIYEKCTFVKMP